MMVWEVFVSVLDDDVCVGRCVNVLMLSESESESEMLLRVCVVVDDGCLDFDDFEMSLKVFELC